MILNELQKIKSFGCQLESKVTLEDIERKEAELGCKLPIALKEFYLTFSEEDPIFKSDDRFFTLDQLQVVGGEIKTFINEGNDWCWKFGKTVVFLELKFKTQFIWLFKSRIHAWKIRLVCIIGQHQTHLFQPVIFLQQKALRIICYTVWEITKCTVNHMLLCPMVVAIIVKIKISLKKFKY